MATYPVYPATTFTQAVELTIFASNQLHDVINGDALTTVETENGDIPTLRKALVDNFYFKTPVAWVTGETSTVFNQLYYYKETEIVAGWYYAPQATLDNPIPMGATPADDDNWRLYQPATQSVPAEVFPWSTDILTTMTIATPPYEFDTAIVTVNGVVLVPEKDYIISNSTIIFTTPLTPEPDAEVVDTLFCYLGKIEQGVIDDSYVTYGILAQATGAQLIGYKNVLNTEFTLDGYINEGYIRVKSRDELVAAVNYVNTVIKKPTEIRLSRVFQAWTAATTELDLTWVSLVGEGGFSYIDATGIPNVEGNYWLRIYNSGASNINNLGNMYTDKIAGVFVLGPGATTNVDAILYHAPTGSISSFTTRHFGTMSFRTGDSYRNNAYIIKHWGRSISRCTNLAWMPSGYSNYGEAIEYYASTLSTASGATAIQNNNPNGAIRFHGGSVDYIGRVAVATAGRIEFINTHIEFNNSSNQLSGVPFETSTAETAEIVISGGEILGYIAPLPIVVTTLFRCGSNTNGITLNNVKLMRLTLPTGNFTINDGTGPFKTNGVVCIAGGGNPEVPMLKSDTQNLLVDPNFTQTSIVDWYISADTGTLTSRTAGVNLNLTKDSVTFRPGGDASMKVVKAFGVGSASEIQLRVPIDHDKLDMYELYMLGTGLTGSIFVNAYYACNLYHNSLGIPISARSVQVGPTRTVDATTLTDWSRIGQQAARNYAPSWATHYVIRISLVSMSAGTLYIDDAKVTEL